MFLWRLNSSHYCAVLLRSASPERPGVTEVPTALRGAPPPPQTLHCSFPLKVYWCQQPCKISVAKTCFLCWRNLHLDINRCVVFRSMIECTCLHISYMWMKRKLLFIFILTCSFMKELPKYLSMPDNSVSASKHQTTPCRFTDSM